MRTESEKILMIKEALIQKKVILESKINNMTEFKCVVYVEQILLKEILQLLEIINE